MNKAIAALCALIAGCSFGVGGAISQVIRSHGFEVMHVILSQTIVGVIVLGILLVVKFRQSIPLKDTVKLAVLGMVDVLASICYFFAIDMLSVGTTVALQFQYVWMTVAFVAIADRRMPGKWTLVSSVLIIAGSLMGSGLVDEAMAGAVTMDPLGLLLALGCALFYASFIFFNGRIATEFEPVPRAFYQTCGSLLAVVIAYFAMGTPPCDVVTLAPWGILMGFVMCVIPILFIVIASTNLDGGLVSILTSSELPMAVFSGYIILNETVTPLVIVGVVVILGSIALAQLDNRDGGAATVEEAL